MTAINTNVGALNARLYTLGANKDQQQAMERLSSGSRVNSAADDAAGLAVAGKMNPNCAVSTWQFVTTRMALA